MTLIVDRRQEPVRHTFGKDKARFLHRIRDAVKAAVHGKAAEDSIKDIGKGGVKIPVPKKITQEPIIHHERSPIFKKVFPGNLYDVGDIVPIPSGGGGGGGGDEPGDGEDGQDDFIYLSEKEFLDIFFEGRSLPDMVKLHSEANTVVERQRSGYISKGPSHKLDMNVTNKKRRGEQIIFNKAAERRMLKNYEEQYNIYREYNKDFPEIQLNAAKGKSNQLELLESALQQIGSDANQEEIPEFGSNKLLSSMFNCVSTIENAVDPDLIAEEDNERLEILRKRIPEAMKTKRDAQKFQSRHMTYKFDDEVKKPAAKAVMICKMDVSASMTQDDKNTAKAFFFVLNQFLEKNYDEVEMVFITHTTTAEVVDEEEFFYGQRTGGTIVSSCLEKEQEVMKKYNSNEWNIYSVQASDGDNFGHDNEKVASLMRQTMPLQQASYFIEVRDPRYGISDLHRTYMNLANEIPHLHTATINSPSDAIEAFKSFFPVGGAAPANQPSMG